MTTSAINDHKKKQKHFPGSSNAKMDVTEAATNMATGTNTQKHNNDKEVATQASRNQPIEPNLTCELTAQLEYYFSYQNLIKDDFLRSKMAQHDGYAPVELLAGFNHVVKIFLRSTGGRHMLDLSKEKALQLRSTLLLEAAASSTTLEVAPLVTNPEGNVVVWGIRPRTTDITSPTTEAIPEEVLAMDSFLKTANNGLEDVGSTKYRHKVIFRCVPKGVTQEDICSIIQRASEGLEAQIESIHEDVGDCWYVDFKEDFDNKNIIADCILRMRDMDLLGQTIKARLKTEPIRDPSTTVLTTNTVARQMLVPTSTEPTLHSNQERRRMPKKGRSKSDKANGNSPPHGGGYVPRKPHHKRNGGNANGTSYNAGTTTATTTTTTTRYNRSPPGVHDSNHFPVLGNRNANTSPITTTTTTTTPPQQQQCVREGASNDDKQQITVTSNVLHTTSTAITKVDTDPMPTATATTVPVMNETKEIHGAYAAALLRCTTNPATVDPSNRLATTTAIATKQESTPKKSTSGCWVRGYPVVAANENNKNSSTSNPQIDIEHTNAKGNNTCDKVDCNFTSSCSIDNEVETEKTASTTLSISSASSGTSTPVQPISSSWGGLKKSFADIVKAQQVCIS